MLYISMIGLTFCRMLRNPSQSAHLNERPALLLHIILRDRHTPDIVLCHNHPSGNAAPSRSDDHLTEELFVAARTVKIPLIDHIIVADGDYYSYADEGKIIC